MKKALLISAGILLLVVAVAVVWSVAHLESYYSRPYATFVTTSGEVGDLRIGELKSDMIGRLSSQSFAIDPKPSECPINWIEVSSMSDVYRTCLLNAERWEEGHASTRNLCKANSNAFTKLSFHDDRLVSVTTECWHPE
jgi:hypothetical protein